MKAGFQQNDEIIQINDQKIQTLSDMRKIVDTVKANTKIFVKMWRGSLEVQYALATDGIKVWDKKPILQSSPPPENWQSAF